MKNKITSIKGKGKKKTGLVIAGLILTLVIGTGLVFAANGSAYQYPYNEENCTSLPFMQTSPEAYLYRTLREFKQVSGGWHFFSPINAIIDYPAPTHIELSHILHIHYSAWDSPWGYGEEAALLEMARHLFDYILELHVLIFHVRGGSIGDHESVYRFSRFIATRDKINGAEYWCSDVHYLHQFNFKLHVCHEGWPFFMWMPQGYDHDSVRLIVDSLPLPCDEWQVEMVAVSDYFIEYGSHVYTIAIQYILPDYSRVQPSSAGYGLLILNAQRLFEHFDELTHVIFKLGDWPAWFTVDRQ